MSNKCYIIKCGEINRKERAQTMYLSGCRVLFIEKGEYDVQSQVNSNQFYRTIIREDDKSCKCDDYYYRHEDKEYQKCKHMVLIELCLEDHENIEKFNSNENINLNKKMETKKMITRNKKRKRK